MSRKGFALITCTACDRLCFVIVCSSFSSGPLEFSEFGIAAAWFGLACCSGVETGICQSLRLSGPGVRGLSVLLLKECASPGREVCVFSVGGVLQVQ